MPATYPIESMLSARLFMSPQLVGDRIFFISNMSGRLSLYAMDRGGSVPEPLLPPHIALQNPELMGGYSFFVYPKLGKILVHIDRDGDENYQPTFVPIDGGLPEPVFGDRFAGQQVHATHCDIDRNLAVFSVDPRTNPNYHSYLAHLDTLELEDLGSSLYHNFFDSHDEDYARIVLIDTYTSGDHVLYMWEKATGQRRLLYGTPLDKRAPGEQVPLNSLQETHFVAVGRGLLLLTSLFDDRYGLGYLPLGEGPAGEIQPVAVEGISHQGDGEMTGLKHLAGDRFLVSYNVDGVSWAYEGNWDVARLCFQADRVVCGTEPLNQGVLQSLSYEKASGDYAVSFSTATRPAQIYTIAAEGQIDQHTRERILGIPQHLFSAGEEAAYTSHDGLRVSARLYLPAEELGFTGPRPVVFYIHGGPQSQEKPDFTWFSMPLIQFLTLSGLAVWVPNVRGSSGYGLEYMKRVDNDWGGQDRLDHVAAFEHLRADPRLDMDRVGVVGRSYGGYMTLMLAGRHPELWKAACDMFGPYNLITFIQRLPETWQTYFHQVLGHPDHDREALLAMSPSTYLPQLACPLFVIQGRNDPRVREAESRDVVEQLRAQGKTVEFLVFENEGHDVLKFENKVRCYNEIVQFFIRHLEPGRGGA